MEQPRVAARLAAPGRAGSTAILLFVFSVLLYAPTLLAGFCHDDQTVVVGNSHVHGRPMPLAAIFTSSYLAGAGRDDGSYRPLAILSFAVADRPSTGSAFWQHLTSVLLNAVVTVLLFVVSRRPFGLRAAAIAAALFASHPVHAEAVAYVTGRAEVLALGFGLTAAWLHQRGRAALAAPFVLAALLSKETALTTPFLLAAAVLVFDRDHRTRALWPLAAFAVYLVARVGVVGGFDVPTGDARSFVTNPLTALSPVERLLPALSLQGAYLVKLVAPIRLSVDYSYAAIDAASAVSLPRVLAASAAAVGTVWLLVRDRVLGAVALAGWVTFVPFNNTLLPGGTIFAERLLYMPSAFAAVLLGSALARLDRRRAAAIGLALVVLLSARTVVRVADWSDDHALFKAAYEGGSADSVIVLHNYAYHLTKDGEHRDLELAARLLERARAIHPDFGAPLVTLGGIYMRLGRVGEARRAIDAHLARHPDDARARRVRDELLASDGARRAIAR